MEKYAVYVLINVSLQELFFGFAEMEKEIEALPPEIAHWDTENHRIDPVILEEALLLEEAAAAVWALQEKALRDPQGKTVLLNRSV